MDTLGIIRQLEGDAALRAQLRAVLLGDELLELPGLVRRIDTILEELAQAQARTEERLEELAQAQARTEERLEELAQAQARTEERLEELAHAQARTEERLAHFEAAVEHRFLALERDLGNVKGSALQARVQMDPRRFVPRRLATAVRVVDSERFERLVGALDEVHGEDVQLADALIDACVGGREVVFVVEAAWKAHLDDVERAARRAYALRPAGVDARALVVSHADPGPAVLAAAARRGVALVGETTGLLTPSEPSAN